MTDVAKGPGWELRLGDYREVLADVTRDVLLCDQPYSARTHEGQRSGCKERSTITYPSWSEEDATRLAEWGASRVRWWSAIFSDHALVRDHERAWSAAGWYTFVPVGWLRESPMPRISGDGPCSAFDYIMVARPKHRMPSDRMGSRPGVYRAVVGAHTTEHPGGKSVDGMRAIIRDYTLPGDVVVDTCAGGATTLLAAVIEGRTAIGAERDPETWEKAVRRLRRGYTAVFDFGGAR